MTVTLGILALLEAKADKGEQLAAFLKAGRELAVAEQGTVTWYAFKISDTSYGILDTFATDDARTAHINGQIPAALAQVSADLLGPRTGHPARQGPSRQVKRPASCPGRAPSPPVHLRQFGLRRGDVRRAGERADRLKDIFSAPSLMLTRRAWARQAADFLPGGHRSYKR